MSKKTVNPKIIHKAPQGVKPVTPVSVAKTVISGSRLQWALILFLLLFVSLLYFPVAFQTKAPQASDITQWRGAANKIIEYNKTHADNALWTESMFSGMPAYMISFPNRFPFLENISRLTDKVINWRIFLLFIGALGVFFLLRFMKMDPLTSFFGAVAFMFSCHWLGLVEIGHNTKFRAIMYIPWVLWALLNLRKKPGLLGFGFLASMLIVQLRENHPQISYYLYLFVGMYWVWQLIESIHSKDLKSFAIFTGLAVLAFGLTLLAVMNPYMSTMEYSKFTMRGGAAGLETSYAQGWSFHPLETLGFIIPDFYGGVSPTYWGYMPFTQIYNYFGLVVLALGVLALVGSKHRRMAIFLSITSFIFLLLSFGNFAPKLSDLFLNYLPYFNKFRVPSMILTMVQINAVILAALGLDTLLDRTDSGNQKWTKNLFKVFWICGGVFLLWLVAAKSIFAGLNFTNAQELAKYEAQGALDQLDSLKIQRLGLLYKSGILSLLFLTVSMGLAYLRSVKKLPRLAFILLITVIVFVDLYVYTGKSLKKVDDPQTHQEAFVQQEYDQFLLQDASNYRIYPIISSPYGNQPELRQYVQFPSLNRTKGEWAYHHQTVDGYSAAKLERYDRLIVNDTNPVIPSEWYRYVYGILQGSEMPTPVLDMLSVKYIIHPDSIIGGSLTTKFQPVYSSYDGNREYLYIYENKGALPRAWFVQSVQKVSPADSILHLLRSVNFNPHRLAYVETDIRNVQAPDSSRVKQTVNEMHKLAYELYTDKPSFLVLSEIYYPAGWKAILDGKEIPIHPANYVLRGLQIPSGKHKLELVFAPATYAQSVTLSLIGLLLSFLALVGGLVLWYLKRKRQTLETQH